MKKGLLFLLVAFIFTAIYWFGFRNNKSDAPDVPKQEAIALQKHSDSFNLAVNHFVDAYILMKDAFVEANMEDAKRHAKAFVLALDSIPMSELSGDSAAIANSVEIITKDIKSNAQNLILGTDITQMRMNFSSISDLIYPGFVKLINYEGPQLYIQNCPMAFNDEVSANWLSKESEVVNPYLGKHHPTYKAGMLHCGSVLDSLNTQ